MNRFSIAAGVVCLMFLAATAAAQPSFTNQLPVDSPILYRQFFQFHASFNEWLTTRTAGKSAAEATSLNLQAAAHFGLKESDHRQVTAITAAIAKDLSAIDQEEITHINARARLEQHPVRTVVQQLEARRQDAVSRGMTQLQRTLAADAWTTLRGYINGQYRSQIKVQ